MSGAPILLLAAAVAQAPLPQAPPQQGAQVSARVTVEILRSESNSETGGAEALKRHVSRPEPGRVTIAFE
ncbi:MAG: hypothetical protein U1E37_08665 [Sphingomonadaceae bacterium]